MESQQFTYWLQGFVELNGGQQPTPEQWKMICEHLSTVFVKITSPLYPDTPIPLNVPMPPIFPDFTPIC